MLLSCLVQKTDWIDLILFLQSMDFSIGELGLNPIKTRSSHGDNMLPGKGQFMFDSIPSTLAHNQDNSSYAFADSVPSTPAYNPQNAFAASVPRGL